MKMKVALIFIVIIIGFSISAYLGHIQKQQQSENKDDGAPE